MNKNSQFPLKSHKVMLRLAVSAALLSWFSPARAQVMASYTGWPLMGVHANQPCATCHKNNTFKGTSPACYSCHQTDYNNAKTPVDHIASKFPTTCDSCHKLSDATWMLASFSHTTFPLAGVHATTPCATCHNPPYAPSANNTTAVPTTCYGCHQTDYNKAKTPVDHIASKFPTTCDSCHKFSDATWMLASFSHTTFPLVGVHATTPCATCHNPPYAPSANNTTAVPTTCYGCHVRDFTAATSPVPHTGFATTCDSCHKNTDATWSQKGAFVHNTFFALAGAHVTAPCSQCHNPPYAPSANNYMSVPKTPCSACHQTDYNNAKTPVNHIASNFPNTCDSCHKFSDATWMLATFSHTTFPLVGVHSTTACTTCHNPPYAPSANNYTTVPTTCYGCHVRDFTAATSPVPHTGFATTCDSCHRNTDATWSLKGAFVHNTYFALAGAHVTAPCSQCHNPPYAPSANNYMSVPTTPCSSCHQKDYLAAKTPIDHIASSFPNTCDSCHKFSDATWLLGTFNHTAFPIASGRHNVPCAQCHTTPNVFTVFNCTGCHTASQTTPHHSGVKGYVWTSVACYSCHPSGRAG